MIFFKNYADYFIFGTLFLMSLIMVYKVIERSIFLKTYNSNKAANIHELELKLTSGLTPIYTIGATAPYIGLLGTVIGILITFYDMGQNNGTLNASEIMLGLALALKATALGISVAIPSVISYNVLIKKVEDKKLYWHSIN